MEERLSKLTLCFSFVYDATVEKIDFVHRQNKINFEHYKHNGF